MKKIISTILILSLCLTVMPVFAEETEKEETVYGLLNADGSVERLIITDHIMKSNETVAFTTDLENIELLMNDAKLDQNNETYTVSTLDSDVYFRGTLVKELPVETHITYMLDGQNIEPENLKGQSGHLIMTLQQVNREKRTIQVEGVESSVYLPFETAVVMRLDNHRFDAVTVSSGKLIDDGTMKVFSAVLTPGMTEMLGFEHEMLVDSITLEADVTEFELASIYMTTICKLPEIDLSFYSDEMTQFESKITTFEDAGTTLVDGINVLDDGVMKYFKNQSEAIKGLDEYMTGNEKVLQGITEFNNAMIDFNSALKLYTSGVIEVLLGLNQLNQQMPELVKGLEMFRQGFEQAVPEMAAPELHSRLNQYESGLLAFSQGLNTLNEAGQVLSSRSEAVNLGVDRLGLGAAELSTGAMALLENTETLTTGFSNLDGASSDLIDGMVAYKTGVEAFKIDGIDALSHQVEEAVARIEAFDLKYDQLKLMVASYNSFSRSDIEGRVVFILKTSAID